MFGTKHLIILAICALYIAASLILLKKKKPKLKTVEKILLCIGIVSETLKVFSYIVKNEEEMGGYLPKTDLPFHLCSIQIIFILMITLSENEKLKRALHSFMLPTCLIGGIAALMIPTSSSLNMPVITVQYFLYHSSIIVFSVFLYMTDEIKFEFKDYVSSLLMLYAFFFIAIYLNSWVNDYSGGINFMYVVNPPVDGLPFLNKNSGWLVYIIRYAVLAAVCITCCYIKPVLLKISSLCGKKSSN